MEFIVPEVFRLAQTEVNEFGLQRYLAGVGIPDWITDARSGAEKLIEVCGRTCYKSFQPGLNKNVTKIREGNRPYLQNIIKSKHGGVIEHGYVTYAILHCSRVLTHELVRHRPNDYSQESLRYVRLDKLKAWFPSIFSQGTKEQEEATRKIFIKHFEAAEGVQLELAQLWQIDESQDFNWKKKLTSAFRRMAPIGLATTIIFTANHRMLRFMLEQRTSRHAEEEIRLAFGDIYDDLIKLYPNIYQDAKVEVVDGYKEVTFEFSKI